MTAAQLMRVTREAFADWSRDNVQRLSASVAFYTVMSLAPLLVILIAIAGSVLGRQAAEGALVRQIQDQVGPQGARIIADLLKWRPPGAHGGLAIALGALVLLFSASAVFSEFQDALNIVWDVKPSPESALRTILRRRLFAFLMIVSLGVLLLASLLFSAALAQAGKYAAASGFSASPAAWQAINFVVSFFVIMALLAAVYKVVPDARIPWRGVWLGAAVSSLLFTIGKELIGLYLGRSASVSAYGAAGSLVVLLIWIYYSTQIVFFGAEFAEVWVNEYGTGIQPEQHAEVALNKPRVLKGLARKREAAERVAEEEPRRVA